MKNLITLIESLCVSITFAEAGDHATSQRILNQAPDGPLEEKPCPAL